MWDVQDFLYIVKIIIRNYQIRISQKGGIVMKYILHRQVLIFNQLGSLRSICNVGVSQNRIIFL